MLHGLLRYRRGTRFAGGKARGEIRTEGQLFVQRCRASAPAWPMPQSSVDVSRARHEATVYAHHEQLVPRTCTLRRRALSGRLSLGYTTHAFEEKAGISHGHI